MQSITRAKFEQIFFRYLIAFWTVGIAIVATLLLSPVMQQPGISPLFLLAVMVSSWRGSLGAGLLATFLSGFANAFIFLPPAFSMEIDRNDAYQLIIFSFAAIIIGSLSASRKKAEEAQQHLLAQTQKARVEAEQANAVKDDFLAAVSHELRTPLTTIKTLTRVMQRRETSREEQGEYLKDIASECDRQIDLVHNLLDLSRIKSGGLELESEFIDVGAVIRACEKIESVEAHENDQQIFVEAAPDLHFIRADRNALRRALCTIIENAIKFTAPGGKITLRAFNCEQQIVIEVEDTGRGIRPEDLPYIFDKFYRGRPLPEASEALTAPPIPGAGLGLNLANALISGMKGSITVKSRLGEGSIFTVCLPIWRERSDEGNSELNSNYPSAALDHSHDQIN